VIGFASAADAEEAGYTADPTDGTASQATMAPGFGSFGGGSVAGNDAQETRYLGRVVPLLVRAQSDAKAVGEHFSQSMQNSRGRGQGAAMVVMLRQTMAQLLGQTRATSRSFESIRPPARFRRLHSLMAQSLRDSNTAISALNRMTVTGNFGALMQMQGQLKRMQLTELQLRQEISRLGLESQMGMVMRPNGAAR